MGNPLRLLCALMLSLLAAGCEPISLVMLGVGASAGVTHQMSGLTYKTFAEPSARVKRATLAALKHMAIQVERIDKIDNGELIKAKAADRNIEIELEALTLNTTRMRTVARRDGGLVVDSATAVEIITQTEKMLGTNKI